MKPKNLAGISLGIPLILVPYAYSYFFDAYWRALNHADRGVCPSCQSIVLASYIVPVTLIIISIIVACIALQKIKAGQDQGGRGLARWAIIIDVLILLAIISFPILRSLQQI